MSLSQSLSQVQVQCHSGLHSGLTYHANYARLLDLSDQGYLLLSWQAAAVCVPYSSDHAQADSLSSSVYRVAQIQALLQLIVSMA